MQIRSSLACKATLYPSYLKELCCCHTYDLTDPSKLSQYQQQRGNS